jgi:hypothetical protein
MLPSVIVKMRLTIQDTKNDEIFSIEIEDDGKVEYIKILVSIERNLQVEEIVLMFNGRLLAQDFAAAKSQGIKQDDILLLTTQQALRGAQMLQQRAPARPAQPVSSANDANLLNSFFTDLSKQNIQVPQQPQRLGGQNFFNQVFGNQQAQAIAREA